jgi:hypothetical protein
MKKEHLNFLEYILPILYREYPEIVMLKYLEAEYNKDNKIELNELSHLYELYNGEYFQIVMQESFCKLTPLGKDIIENHGSLSKYLEFEKKESNKKLIIKIFKKSWKIIVGIGIILTMILTVIEIYDSSNKKETNSKKPKLIKESEKSNENSQNKDSVNAQSDSLYF